ncbi:MAG: hypothetical protein ACXABY_21060 [Candidatus Thorarchaeota archaeon]|jgi:hypothetical protein
MPTRRDLLKGFFSGAILIGTGVGVSQIVQVFHKHDHYVAPGKWNIWYVHDKKWHLLSDRYEAPFEFDSKEDAERYADTVGLEKYDRWSGIDQLQSKYRREVSGATPEGFVRWVEENNFQKMYSPEGKISIRPAPEVIHNFDYMRHTLETATQMVDDWQVKNPAARQTMIEMLMADDGAEQTKVWVGNLKTSRKKDLLTLQNNKDAKSFIRGIYLGPGRTYHNTLAKLQTFSPAEPTWA